MSFKSTFRFSQCNLLDETTTVNTSFTCCNEKKKNDSKNHQQQITKPIDDLEKSLREMDIYEEKLSTFCGVWEDYPHRYYRMKFCIEMGQLVGYSNIDGGKALVSYDGYIINMVIIHSKESGRPLDHYRGRLGWNKKYIKWVKEDPSQQSGWRSTRRWNKIE